MPLVPTSVTSLNAEGSVLLGHELFTNDVLYLEAAFDMRPLPVELLPLVPLFCRSLTQMGTEKESFVELTERIGRKTGGVSVYPFTSAKRGQDEPVAYIMLRGKAMGATAGDMVAIMRDILTTARLDDKARFTQMVLETKAGLESGIIGSGHRFASARLAAQRSTAGWVSEAMGGLSYLEYVRALAKRVESDWDSVKADLERIRTLLLQRRGAIINATGDARALGAAQRYAAEELLAALPADSAPAAGWKGALPRVNEALVVPTQVNYVGKAANLYADAGYTLSGAAYVIEKYLGTSWLWDKAAFLFGGE
ncbi:hypothetical protein MNEG_15047 [Monoraphidium neglectum]|uniref:Peptidase M16C associated domain-containing protein n=1 Tax=Monoraphidium neglectum TaxID=145388 RepID=A0A0D2LT42_9CHLO|nr:hypothetical protein MNEG_15047 [Monoraphidium neglectum]KIY92916.1 hypothetical protein MNEG_15047 [Monoraphidium neglectum]|eukprot:XP_013891936.1 hypothetical protein MNEG_15047 [Monoraphidium neglectum]